jgi:glycosyltransferase involved in cell wall biosynthesis
MTGPLAPERIRVLRVIARLNVGGPAIHVSLLNSGLDPGRFECRLVSGSENPGEGSMLYYARARGVEPIVVPEMVGQAAFGPRDVAALRALVPLIRSFRPHIVHTHTAKAGFLGRIAARVARVPVVIHTYHGHVLSGYYGRGMNIALRRMEQALGWVSDCLVAVSDRVRDDLVAYGVARRERIRVILLGLDLAPFFEAEAHRGAFRREVGLSPSDLVVGIVGRIFPIKNHRLFLDAASRVAGREPAARFVIVGDGQLRAETEAHARALGLESRVLFTGWREDLPRICADLDLLAVSSINEGTPVSAIEAMAASRPVVATRVGGLVDLLDDGVTGRLVTPGDPDALSAAILDLLGDPARRARMGAEARQVAHERYRAERLVRDVAALYEELLAEKGVTAG